MPALSLALKLDDKESEKESEKASEWERENVLYVWMCACVCFVQCLYFLFFLHIYSFMNLSALCPSVLYLIRCAPTLNMSGFKKHHPV